ncbi:MAG: response regulator transcription factor [Campylobacter sp.]
MSENLKQINILLVEDEAGTRKQLTDVFEGKFGKVIVATNGDEGLKKFKKYTPNIVVTDILMPIIDGLDMARQIKEISKDTPIIVLSAFSEKERLLKAIDVGIDKYLIKPIDVEELFVVLNDIVDTKILKSEMIRISDEYFFNNSKKVLVKNGNEIALTKKELSFISLLVMRLGTLVLIEEIKRVVWVGEKVNDTAIRTFVKRVRDKVGQEFIKNSPGLGYQIDIK